MKKFLLISSILLGGVVVSKGITTLGGPTLSGAPTSGSGTNIYITTNGIDGATSSSIAQTNIAGKVPDMLNSGTNNFAGGVTTTNLTQYLSTTRRAPYWTVETFGGDGYHYYLNLPGIGPFIRVRSNSVPARALYLGAVDEGGSTVLDAVSVQVPGNGYGNTDPRITFVVNGPHLNAGAVEIANDPSWQFHADAFGADYIDVNTFDHMSLWAMQHDFTNNFYFGVTNYQTSIRGTNILLTTNVTATGTLKPSGGIIGDRTVTSFSMSHATLYTNGIYRAWFFATVMLDPGGGNSSAKIVTYKQNNTSTNFWADVYDEDPSSAFIMPRFQISAPLNPGEVFYVESGGTGGPPTITNAKIVAE